MGRRLPLVVILGATGSGKTKLSLELAQRFKGEIIGADSMQVYKGLDIITAKATEEEQAAAPHHMIDILEPHETFTVLEFRNRALKIIENLFNRNKLPIVVGGTNYYIESLLWRILVADPTDETPSKPRLAKDFEMSSEELHEELKRLDPAMAKRLHPNNKRKIFRSLEVLQQQGRRHSEILEEQQKAKGGSPSGGGLRFPDALIFRLQCENSILDERLDRRVDAMLQQGLVEELTQFHRDYNAHRCTPDYTTGIFQSIGFKEFHPYLTAADEESEGGIFKRCVEDLKIATRRYARKQNKWITNRFLGRTDREVPPLYGLDVGDLTQWTNNVLVPAVEIVHCYVTEKPCDYKRLPFEVVNSTPNTEDESFYCDVCSRVFVGDLQWRAHRRSNNHKKMAARHHKLLKCNSVT